MGMAWSTAAEGSGEMKTVYEFFEQSDIFVIHASTRTEAIEILHQQTGMPIDYIKQHMRIKNIGRIDE